MDKVTAALDQYIEGSDEKWYFKALRVKELIEIELDERVSIG
jgi:hypothetical protein